MVVDDFCGRSWVANINAIKETTAEMTNLRALVEQAPAAEILGEMIGFAAERLVEIAVAGLTGAGYGENSPERLARRKGYRARDRERRAGAVELRIPKLRHGSFFRAFSSRAGWPRRRCLSLCARNRTGIFTENRPTWIYGLMVRRGSSFWCSPFVLLMLRRSL